jgi:hypothetical protein
MSEFNFNAVVEDLGSNHIERQTPALDKATEIVNLLVLQAVNALIESPNRFLVAERLSRFGSLVIPHLEKLLPDSDDLEVKILSSLVLLQLNSKSGLPILLEAISPDCEYAGLVARHLAKAKIDKAIQPIVDCLNLCTFEEIDLVVNLLEALAELDGDLPTELHQRMSNKDILWQISTTYKQFFAAKNIPQFVA